jgi:hypothetical protein
MKSKSIANILNKTTSVVDFFELNNETITCFCFNPNDDAEENYTLVNVKLTDFEKWLNDEGFLKGYYERIVCPHEMTTTVDTWSFTIEEFMSGENQHWNINTLLTNFLNKTKDTNGIFN